MERGPDARTGEPFADARAKSGRSTVLRLLEGAGRAYSAAAATWFVVAQERLVSRLSALGTRFDYTGGCRRCLFRLLYLLRARTCTVICGLPREADRRCRAERVPGERASRVRTFWTSLLVSFSAGTTADAAGVVCDWATPTRETKAIAPTVERAIRPNRVDLEVFIRCSFWVVRVAPRRVGLGVQCACRNRTKRP